MLKKGGGAACNLTFENVLSAKNKKLIGIKAKTESVVISETELGAICNIGYPLSFLVMLFARGVPTVY